MKTLLFLITFLSAGLCRAQIDNPNSLANKQKTILIVSSREDLPRAQEQLEIVNQNEKELETANVNVYMVTPKRIKSIFQKGKSISFNPNSYKNWIDDEHNYMTVLIDEKGVIKFKSPEPVKIQGIFKVFGQDNSRIPVQENVGADTIYNK